jgi:serine/threonine protein kinase/peptidoglycan hydrolase-like protein with peptidoglycan-binding domain
MSGESEHNASLGEASDYGTLRAGQAVGRYRIVAVLGQGGFGITYRATDSELGREVALKEYLPATLAVREHGTTVVPRSTAAAADFTWGRERFIAEGRTLAALHRAPGIVLVHDFLEANGTAYLVMELLAGTTLQQRLQRQGAMNPAAVGRVLWPLLDGLEEVHRAGFLHRDIKPANILLDDAGKPTLIDFGASRAAVAGRSMAMTAIFTPGYAAVEQMTSARQGPWTDIYGLAATLYHAITGGAPPSAVDRLLVDNLQPLTRLAPPGFDPNLLVGLDAALAVRAEQRPQSIADWRRLLRPEQAAAQATIAMPPASAATVAMPPLSAASPSPTPPPAPARKRWTGWRIGGVIACLLVVGGIVHVLRDRQQAPSKGAAVAHVDRAAREAKRAAEAQRLRDQEELTRLRAEAAAREKAEQEAAQRRQIEEETRRQVEAEMAERQRQQEIARQKADAEATAEAKRQADAKAAAAQKQAAEEAVAAQHKVESDRKAAEAAETDLGLSAADRQKIQAALATLGFASGAADGVFGPHTREMIAAWQRKTGRAATGYLGADAQHELLRDAAAAAPPPAQAAVPAAAAPSVASAAPKAGSASCEGSFSAQWCRGAYQNFPSSCWNVPTTIHNGTISGTWVSRGKTEAQTFSGSISPAGEVQIVYQGVGTQTYVDQHFTVGMVGRVADGVITAAGRAGQNGRDFSVRIQCR